MTWKPTTLPGRPPKPCVDCLAETPELAILRPSVWRPTDHAPIRPRCASHQRQVRKASSSNRKATYQARVYGMDPELHEALLVIQGGVCAICLYANGSSKALATDHDHSCCAGRVSRGDCVRGKLCGPDNHDLIGRIELIAKRNNERPADVCLRIMGYFADPPMARLRLRLEQAS